MLFQEGIAMGRSVLTASALLVAVFTAAAQTPGACDQLTKFKIEGTNLAMAKTDSVAAAAAGTVRPGRGPETIPVAVPAYCRVEGTINPRAGVDGKRYGIGFALALPAGWNGGFLFQGGGGLNGSVAAPLGGQAAGDIPALARGFAVVTTDTGHKGAVFDGSFMQDQQAALDFAYAGVGKVTEVAKLMVAQYYGSAAKHSYFDGCSTGGREAMLVTQRYPLYFDGVISGDPAMRTGYSNLADAWVTVLLNQVAPKDDSGKPVSAKALSDADKKLVVNSILQQCDAADGVKDGLIFSKQGCRFEPAALACKGAKTDACLSAAQVQAIQKGFAGPKNARGVNVYAGFPFDTGIAANGQGGIPGLLNPGPSPVGQPNFATSMDVDEAAAAIAANPRTALTDTTSTDLSSFFGHGGKLIFYHGMSDPWFSPLDTLDYYERMAKENGGLDQIAAKSRIYLVPGMGHCQGGAATLDKFDALTAMVNWVEKGTAPDAIVATGKAYPGRSRPLCAWPKFAHYKGSGGSAAVQGQEDARNFECRE
ncbi:MAG TPA: tannase/feruloyl esterase family alpha/beta hydrolase [Bryobacteraceae bacterium]|nr:tannase/feruloyl esterase family alpha/beta hydrolase [Bryobacteraceae bacterium]